MFVEFIKWVVILGLLIMINHQPEKRPPRYWAMDIDSLASMSAHRTDSTLGVDVYLKQMEELIDDFK